MNIRKKYKKPPTRIKPEKNSVQMKQVMGGILSNKVKRI